MMLLVFVLKSLGSYNAYVHAVGVRKHDIQP